MDDYISREDAKKTMAKFIGYGPIDDDMIVRFGIALDMIPPADVRPVKRGEWRYKTMTVPGGKGQTYAKWCCSKCKSKFKDRSNFCPNCGEDMTGGTNG